MKKKLLSLLLVMAMVLTLAPTVVLADPADGTGGDADKVVTPSEDGDNNNATPGGGNNNVTPGGDNNSVTPGGDNNNVTPGGGDNSVTPDGDNNSVTPGGDSSNVTPGDGTQQPSGETVVTCTGDADCKATSDHKPGCPKYTAPAIKCTGGSDCKAAADGHEKNCYKLCTGKADCPNEKTSTSYHQKDCLKLCTKDTSCKNTRGTASAHQEGCPMAKPAGAAAEFTHCLWENGYVYWSYTPVSGTTVDSGKFHIKIQSAAVTPTVSSATFTADGASVSGYKFALAQYRDPLSVEIYYDANTGVTGKCTVSAATVDKAKAVNPSGVSYDPRTGKLSWTMKDVTADSAVASGNDEFYIDFYTSAGKSAANRITVLYLPTYATASKSITTFATVSGSTFSATVPQPTALDAGIEYTVAVQNLNRSDRGEYKFTAVSAGQMVLDLPKAADVTASNVASVIEKLADFGVNTLAAAMINTDNVKNYTALSQAVGTAMNLSLSKGVNSDADALFRSNESKIQMQGAQNSATETGASLKLEVGAPVRAAELLTLPLENGYQNADRVAFSMALTQSKDGYSTTFRSLSAPVLVTLPVPDNISMKNAVVLHYNSGGVYDRALVTSSVTNSSRTITVAVTAFSDFVLTENTAVDNTAVSTDTITDTPAPAPSTGFSDVPADYTFAAQIAWAQQNGIMGGYADGTFRPNNNTNRQQMWMVLGRMAGAAPADMAAARAWSINYGVSDGTNPTGTMTRQQLITMLYRFAKEQGVSISGSKSLDSYSDNGSVANYAKEALAWGVGNGIITGTTDNKLNPQGPATRAHFAAFMYRYANLVSKGQG